MRGIVFTLGCAVAIVVGSTNCSDGTGQTSFDMYMPYHDVNITVPAINQTVAEYEYAGDNALVAIPAACYQKEAAFFGSASNFADRAPDGPDGMFYFRISDPDTEYAKLASMTDCSSGLVVLLHGTSGVRWNPVSYAAALSGLGWVVVLPDSQSQPAEVGYKGAISLKNTSEIDTSNYCGAMDAYNERASSWSKPFMYSTNSENILNDGAKYAEYMERNYRIRALEMDAFVSKRESLLSAFFAASKVFLLGRSEGGAVAGRYYNEALHSKLSGIILSGWSCDFNYFVSCAENARICEDQCSKDIPVLNVVGETDSYFASSSSVSADVAAGATGYGGPITGNCKAAMDAQGFSGHVVVMEGAGHSFLYTHDNAWRSVLGEFLACPTATSLPSLQRPGCQEQNGVYTCDALSESPPCVDWEVNTSVALVGAISGSCVAECSDGTGQTSFDMYLPYHDVSITVPAIDQTVAEYEYAGDNALVAIPAACYQKEAAFFGSASNFADRTPDGPDGMFYFRISDPDTEYAKLASMTDCSSGLVVLLHGTSGVRWNPVSYAAALSGLGWVVVLPDSQSQPAEMGYKGAISLKNTSEIDTSNYCGAMDAYNERASSWSKPFMYSTNSENILNDGAKYAEYMERNYRIRALEMDAFVSKRESLLSAFFAASKVFLLGRSEGGAVAGRYYNEALHSKLSGIILSGWSCDFNYFVSCAENARICEDQCSKDIPVLNVVGETDSYFASSSSVSADVAAGATGYGGPITGNCKAAMDAQGFSGHVVVMEGAGHSFLYTHDNAWRSVLGEFLACPTATSLPSLQRPGCQEQNGVYTCDALSESPPCVDWEVNTSVALVGAISGSCVAECSDGTGQTSFDMYLPYHDVSITVPAIDQTVAEYEYAGDNALVAIPAACYQKEAAFFGSASNFADRTPDGPDGMFYFRISDPDTEYAKLASMTDCSSGLVVLLHGTSGVRWNPVSYAAALSGLGWVVVLPDSQSQPAEMGYKGAISLKNTSEIDTSNYCGAMDAYNERASSWSKPFMYSTNSENILNDGAKYAEYMERNYRIRALEMDAFVSKRESLLSAFFAASKVFLLGRSEGGAVAGRYYNEALHSKLSGIILSGWSCDFNYFVSCAENARICEDQCSKDIPVLNVVGETDSYFASSSSVSADVAAGATGYGGPITGNCKAAMDAQGFSGHVVVMEGAGHSFLYTHDNAWRSVLGEFLACPTATSLPSLQRPGCQEQNGVYTCDALSESPPCVDWEVNTSVALVEVGAVSECDENEIEASAAARTASVLAAALGPLAVLCWTA
ncbi:unnamed protein product [Prorocentrum cordatum]|uniref:Uncharacterized protein n=2 Tax=Prorocentrum cordatum TaxID=2364126 RepID=A0ABN9QGQ2_9DINO|nr:unnamed protein product [Polarella glacialis]